MTGEEPAMLGQSLQVALCYCRQARRSDQEQSARIAGLRGRGESSVIEFEKRITKDAWPAQTDPHKYRKVLFLPCLFYFSSMCSVRSLGT